MAWLSRTTCSLLCHSNPDLTITHVDGDTISGGYVVFETMRKTDPDFALFQGDMIYADNAIPATKEIPADVGGGIWVNNPPKDFVAISVDEFRANWKYNFGDEKMQAFLAQTPVYVQWDDHEVTNNAWPGELIGEPLYPSNTSVDELYVNSLQALYEFNPLMANDPLFRSHRVNKHLEIFFVDYRSFRGPNPDTSNPEDSPMMGEEQLQWVEGLSEFVERDVEGGVVARSAGLGDWWAGRLRRVCAGRSSGVGS